MKKLFFLILSSMCFTYGWAQSEIRSAKAEELHIAMVKAQHENDFKKAIEIGEQELATLRQQDDKTDSLQADNLCRLGYSYNKQANIDKAIEMNKLALETYLRSYKEESPIVTTIYDNLAFYYATKGNKTQATEYSEKATTIAYKVLDDDWNKAAILMHAAENAYNAGNSKDAVTYEEHAVRVYAAYYGEHSDEYIKELDFLVKYYKANNEQEKAQETEDLKKKLKDEQENGYVPLFINFETAEQCKAHTVDAYYACKYYLKHSITADSMFLLSPYIIKFVNYSPDVFVSISEAEKWMSDKNNGLYLPAYLSGFIIYQLEHDTKELTLEAYTSGVISLINWYSRNKAYSGECEAIEDYLKLYSKGRENLFDKIEKDFKKYRKE